MSEEAEIALARETVKRIPLLAGHDGPVERLGGLTNLVFRVGDHCLRIPGKGTEEYIDRINEMIATEAAAHAGVGPDVLYADASSGIFVSRFVRGGVTMTPALFRSIEGAPARAGQAFRKLHASGAVFPARFELFSMIDSYLGLIATKSVALPNGYGDVLKAAEAVRAALSAHPLPNVACHCDPLCENFIDTGHRMWIVDWEYSGMNDPMWDLGDLSVEGEFDSKQEEEMILAYFGGEPSAAERGRIIIYKAMCDLLWTLWGLIQLANDNPADDFRSYADNRFARCRSLMGTSQFAEALEAVATSKSTDT
ncbi:Choline/ethanolamine kinase [Agrobacterium albertimagni AOL15]|uniref:Choline/ethanolamine kinase n=1 Tax=Agrobacterium albertimagni AOL15 TaxID=1156935 RepID=K2QWZ4_9HYPH|nr:phosphotransferase family protein [Agrobacterium albertimagni]EKF59877.1 Choline/ethanolamine kinase [Agrobacterium albertimagni AOL15]